MRIRFMRLPRSTKESRDLAWDQHVKHPTDATRRKVIEQNIPMAVRLANRLGCVMNLSAADIDDLVGVACVALIKAVDGFDATLGYQFSTYAWVSIRRALHASVPQIRGVGTRHYTDAAKRWVVVYQELESKLDRPPNNEEMRQALGYSVRAYERLRVAVMAVTFGIDPIGSVHESMHPGMKRPSGDKITSHDLDAIVDFESQDLIESLIAGMPARQQEMMRLNLYEQVPQSDLAKMYGVSRQSVQQTLKIAFAKVRRRLEARGITSIHDIQGRPR